MPLTVPTPHGIRVPKGKRPPKLVESDVYNVAQRIKEIDSRLFIMLFEGTKKPWVVYEQTESGPQVVSRYEELTPLILEDLRYMAHTPFMERFEKLAREIDKENELNDKKGMSEEAFERFAWNFKNQLRKSGFIHAPAHNSFRFLPNRRRQAQ